jgi:hypothetical protein
LSLSSINSQAELQQLTSTANIFQFSLAIDLYFIDSGVNKSPVGLELGSFNFPGR